MKEPTVFQVIPKHTDAACPPEYVNMVTTFHVPSIVRQAFACGCVECIRYLNRQKLMNWHGGTSHYKNVRDLMRVPSLEEVNAHRRQQHKKQIQDGVE